MRVARVRSISIKAWASDDSYASCYKQVSLIEYTIVMAKDCSLQEVMVMKECKLFKKPEDIHMAYAKEFRDDSERLTGDNKVFE